MTVTFRRYLTPVCLALVAVAALATSSPVRADVENVLKAVQRDGSARVIIRMKADKGAAAWAPTMSAARQREAVAAAVTIIEPAIRNARVREYRAFRTLPFVSATVDREQLMSLAADPSVESVYLVRRERKLESQQLSSSVPSIKVADAWARGHQGGGYSVAVIDGGFNVAHPMLQGKNHGDACFGSDFPGSTVNQCPSGQSPQIGPGAASKCPQGSTRCDHGTNVASIAVGNDGVNFGVARASKLVPVDVYSLVTTAEDCSSAGLATPCELTDVDAVMRAFDYVNERAVELKIAAVNYSNGGAVRDGYCDEDPRKPVIDMLRQKGVAVTISSGNEGVTGGITVPSCISTAVAVGASTDGAVVASLSNFAPTLDFLAPGVSVRAAAGSGNSFITLSGTSMSAPHVAGAWAVVRSAFPGATFDQIETALKQTGLAVTRVNAGYSVPKIQVSDAIDRLSGKGRHLFNHTVSSVGAALGESFLRFFNNSNAGGTVTITLRDVGTGQSLGSWTSPNIPGGSAPQIAMKTLEEKALVTQPAFLNSRTYYNVEISSTFAGYIQHVLWARNAGVFANLSSCAGGPAVDGTVAQNVHASSISSYVSRLRIVNVGEVAAAATLSVLHPNTGFELAQWTSPVIAAGGSIEVTMQQIEDQIEALRPIATNALTQYNVRLLPYSGYIQHVMENSAVGALVDMSAKCELAPAAAAVTTNTGN